MAKNKRFNRNRHNRQHNQRNRQQQPQHQRQGPPRAPQPHHPQPQHQIVQPNRAVVRSQAIETPGRTSRTTTTARSSAGMTREEKYASLFIIAAFLAAMYFLLF